MRTLYEGTRGNDVAIVQSVLNRFGFNAGPVDGIFGPQTRAAVMRFQASRGLAADGIVGPNTHRALRPLISGYIVHTVRPGDTLFRMAQAYGTDVSAIITANPNVVSANLQIGQNIVVPLGQDVVLTNVGYDYSLLELNLEGLMARYPFLEVGIAGASVLGRNLYYLRIGRGPREVFYNAAHHSLEWINTPVMMRFAEQFLKAYSQGTNLRGYNVRSIYESSSIYIIPMVNPDGVDIVINGITPENPYYSQVLAQNTTGRPLGQVWNANIRGTDLNRNYPAGWEEAKAQEEMLGIFGPGPTRFGGPYPLSEPETQTLVNFTRTHNFMLTMSYHTQGEVIYWQFRNLAPPSAYEIAQVLSRASGYEVSDVPYEAAYAGYKDWFIQEYRRPGFTIETGLGTNPLPISQFPRIYEDNEEMLLLGPIV